MITSRNLILIGTGLALVFLSTTYIGNCSRGNKVEKREQARVKALDQDSINTALAKRFIAREDRVIDSMKKVNEKNRAFYTSQVKEDNRIEKKYRAIPTLPLCDSVIDSKNNRIATLEKIVVDQDTALAASGRKARLLLGLVDSKDQTISDLNRGWQESNGALKKALKPKRIGIGIAAGYFVGPSLKPEPGVGIVASYNLIRF